jgi:hypothetical protein
LAFFVSKKRTGKQPFLSDATASVIARFVFDLLRKNPQLGHELIAAAEVEQQKKSPRRSPP